MEEESKPKFLRHRLKSSRQEHLDKGDISAKEEQVARGLKEIYQNSDGSMPDMSHFERGDKKSLLKASFVFSVSCMCLAAALWSVLVILPSKKTFSEDDIVIKVDGPSEVTAGDKIAYDIIYDNKQVFPLRDVAIHVRYPDGFSFTSSSVLATNEAHDEWLIEKVEPKSSGSIHIEGSLSGDVGSSQSIRAFVSYTPENFNSEFQKDANLITKVSDSPVTLVLGAPSQIAVGNTGDIVLTLQPKPGKNSSNLSLELLPSDAFVIKSATPQPDKNKSNVWSFSKLTGEEKVTIHGVFVGHEDDRTADVAAVVRGDYLFATVSSTVTLIKNTIDVSIAINGTVDDVTTHPGDIITGSVIISNNGNIAQTNVVVRAIFDSPSVGKQSMLKWSGIDDPADGNVIGEQLSSDVRRGIIDWDSTKVPGLKKIDPGKTVTIDFRLPIKNTQEFNFADTKLTTILANAEVQFGKGATQQILSANPINLSLLSDTRLQVRDESSVSNDNKEKHVITWLLTNSLHDLASTTLSADIYGNVSIEPNSISAAAGVAKFDQEKKKMVWEIGYLPSSLDTVALQFTITINSKNPTQTQLVSRVTGRTTDVFAKQDISIVGDEVQLSP